MGTLRYVNSSNGMNVRDDAAGNVITHLYYGDLMYEINPVPVQRELDGVVYYWLYVYYFRGHNTLSQGYGWVAQQYTLEVPSANPTSSDIICSNAELPLHQSLINARYIFQYLSNQGWSNNAIYAILGNMETESWINPGKWEYDPQTPPGGFGLVQWTPATKYTNWLSPQQNPNDINNQLNRILWEVVNGGQWDEDGHSPSMTFSEFTVSNNTPESLAEYFLKCYEMPPNATLEVPIRKNNASKWHTVFDNL